MTVAAETPGSPAASGLEYYIYAPDGANVASFGSDYYGRGQSSPFTLPESGTYVVRVTHDWNYTGEYDLRVTEAAPGVQMETETNDSVSNATPLTLAASGSNFAATVAGAISTSSDLDYYKLGTISAGQTIFLTTQLPGASGLDPVVSVYDANNGYMVEAGNGRPFDGVAQVNITKSGVYYAVVRGGNGTGGLPDQYLLNALVVPTGSVDFPNLQVTNVDVPTASGTESGQTISFDFTVANVGNEPTAVANWNDRVVLSSDPILGNADDLSLTPSVFAHSGVLNPGDSYTATVSAKLPDGISGDYYLIADNNNNNNNNNVNEFLLEGDNVTASAKTFHLHGQRAFCAS